MNLIRLLLIALFLHVPMGMDAQAARIGRSAPEIDLETIDGRRVKLSNLRGYPVVVSFWATWCPLCTTEFEELVKRYDELAPSGLRIMAVNGRDYELSTSDVRKFVARFNIRFDVVLDTRGAARRAYGIPGVPTTVFIDSAGVVKSIHFGAITGTQLASGIKQIRRH